MSDAADSAPKGEFKGGKHWHFKSGPDWKGNRFGRPKKPVVPPPPPDPKTVAREKSVRAVEILGEIMEDKNASTANRITAANAILDRGYGKPQQHIEATLTPFEKMSTNELLEFITAKMVDVTDYSAVDRMTGADQYEGDEEEGEEPGDEEETG